MPLSDGMQRAAESAAFPGLAEALEVCHFEQVVQLLGYKESFMGTTAVSDAHAGRLRDDLRRVRDEHTAEGALCGGLTSLPADAAGIARVRTLIYAARREFRKEEAADVAVAALPAAPTNTSGTSTRETIVCDRPDSPLRIGLRFHALGPPPSAPHLPVIMGGGTDDKFAAYRAVVTLHPGYTVVMVARPPVSADDDWSECYFRVPGHNFGLASAVLNFYHVAEPPTVFSRLLWNACNQVL